MFYVFIGNLKWKFVEIFRFIWWLLLGTLYIFLTHTKKQNIQVLLLLNGYGGCGNNDDNDNGNYLVAVAR